MEVRRWVTVFLHGMFSEDNFFDVPKCGHLAGKVLVPTSTHISRFIAARFQLDMLKSTMLLIARTDSEAGKLISSTVDVADHEFIVGTTTPDTKSLAQAVDEAEAAGKSSREIDEVEVNWTASHEMCTFNQGPGFFNSGVYLLIQD
jgi:isocitrate lyase